MRQYIDIVERANTSQPLFESLLLEYDTFSKQELAPAFAALYEAVSKREATDRLLASVLAHHNNNISDAVEAIKQHKAKAGAVAPASPASGATAAAPAAAPSGAGTGQASPANFPKFGPTPASPAPGATAPGDVSQQPDTKEPDLLSADPELKLQTSKAQGALSQVKSALDKWYTLANRKVPLVSDADSWIDNQIKKILGQIDKVEDDSKFGPYKSRLRRTVRWFGDYQKANPVKSGIVVATLGIIAGLLGSGYGWAFAAVMMVVRLAMMVINGTKFSTALTKTLTTTGASVLLGMGLNALFNNIFGLQQAAPAGDPAQAAAAERAASELTDRAPTMPVTQPLATTPYIEALRKIVDPTGEGVGIPTMTQEKFGQAWRAAREAMGPGNVFVWDGKPFTTNTREEGLLFGLSDAAKRFLRGIR